ncbi:iron-sulfur cluster assembly scaffold protein [Mesoplasma photuris]|uniref:iron-sulfur cluster assembly scaffold protein n=1 Tax=Mesoplasma photuris TaxID=217731 RepID=UPI0004E1221C|nr:iron-sulfur cluster assembly scaffold protein [Mesoplasma photuris]
MIDINNEQELKKIIMNHYVNAENKGFKNGINSFKKEFKSDTCSDEIIAEFIIEDNKFKEINFEGRACAVSTASADILFSMIKDLSFDQALDLIKTYEEMILENKLDNPEKLDKLIAFKNIYKQKNRIMCALLASNGIKEIIIK